MNVNEARETSSVLFCDVDIMFAVKKSNKHNYTKCQCKLPNKKISIIKKG